MPLMKLIEGIEDATLKASLTEAAKTFKTSVNDSNKLAREKIETELKTEKLTTKNLGIELKAQKKELEGFVGAGASVDAKITEMQLKYDAKESEFKKQEEIINGYKNKEKDYSKKSYGKKIMSDIKFLPEFEGDMIDKFTKNLIDGAEEGSYFGQDELGNKVIADTTYKESFIKKYSKYIVAPGSDKGGSGENTGGNAPAKGSKKPGKIKDLIPAEFK